MADEGFLGRWSRRKRDAKAAVPSAGSLAREPVPSDAAPVPAPTAAVPQPPSEEEPLPTLDDVRALTPTSDFTRFLRPDVAAEVKNAAMKKLFADPHFNRMDGLDVYIDDYSTPTPLSLEALGRLASARFLGLGGPEEPQEPAEPPPDAAPPAAPGAKDVDEPG